MHCDHCEQDYERGLRSCGKHNVCPNCLSDESDKAFILSTACPVCQGAPKPTKVTIQPVVASQTQISSSSDERKVKQVPADLQAHVQKQVAACAGRMNRDFDRLHRLLKQREEKLISQINLDASRKDFELKRNRGVLEQELNTINSCIDSVESSLERWGEDEGVELVHAEALLARMMRQQTAESTLVALAYPTSQLKFSTPSAAKIEREARQYGSVSFNSNIQPQLQPRRG